MGKVLAWDWDKKGIGSRFAACMSIYTKAVLCDQRMGPRMVTDRDGRQRLEGDLEQRMHAIVESWNWVCEDLFKEEHEWVTQLTMSESEERILVVHCTPSVKFVPRGEWDIRRYVPKATNTAIQ